MTDHRWIDLAACKRLDLAEFFDDGDDAGSDIARAACRICPVSDSCLADSLRHGDAGFRAGTSTADRRRIRKRRGISTKPAASPFAALEHGSEAGYRRHVRADDPACDRCLAAHAAVNRTNRAAS